MHRLAPLALGDDVAEHPGQEHSKADGDDLRDACRRARDRPLAREERSVLLTQVVEAVPRVLQAVQPEDDEERVRRAEDAGQPHPRFRKLDRTWPVRAVPAQEQDAGQGDHVREHVAEIARREDEVDVLEVEEQADVQQHVDRHGPAGHVALVQDAELPDRHLLLGEGVERPRAVHRGRVHGEEEAAAEADDKEFPEALPRDRVNDVGQPDDARQVVEEAVVADRPEDDDRKHDGQDDVEGAHRGEGLAGVVRRVLVLRRKRRPGLRSVRRPAEDVEPDHDHHELVEERGRIAVELDVRRDEVRVDLVVGEVAGDEAPDGDHEDREDHQGPDDVAEPDRGTHPADVEDPAENDGHDPDQLRPPEGLDDRRVVDRGREVAVASELGEQQVSDQASVDR